MKRVVFISDLHCGHYAGLTPSNYDMPGQKMYDLRREYWNFYVNTLKELQPIYCLCVNGDLIDGSGDRSGGTELLTTDREQQSNMACECIKVANAKHIRITYGTAYHSGIAEDFENLVAKDVNADNICAHDFFEVNGLSFDVKHHIGGGGSPMNRTGAIGKERIWAMLWNARGERPLCDVFVRGHAHYFSYCGDAEFLAITQPALQGAGSKYGERRMSGTVDFGLVYFDIEDKENWQWNYRLLRASKAQVVAAKL